jgi:hypothetical protein
MPQDQYREAEYFIPASKFPQAFAQFRALLEEHKATLGANFVVQLRVTARDDLWLSPFRGEGTCVVGWFLVAMPCITPPFPHPNRGVVR